jgi:hypothetical protein
VATGYFPVTSDLIEPSGFYKRLLVEYSGRLLVVSYLSGDWNVRFDFPGTSRRNWEILGDNKWRFRPISGVHMIRVAFGSG